MRVGIFLHTTDVGTGQTVASAELAERAARAEELGFDSAWIADHFFAVSNQGQRVHALDPFPVLARIALATSRIELGPLVLCAPFRPPAQAAREAMTLQEVSGGRFICGTGAGWFEPEFEAARIPFGSLVSRFESWLEDLNRALEDGTATPGPRPAVWVGAGGPRMLRITARLADGWNAVWGAGDAGWFAEAAERVRAAAAEVGRQRPLTMSAGIAFLPLSGQAAEEALERGRRHARFPRDTRAATGTQRELAAMLRAYASAGAEHLVLSLSTSPGLDFGREMLDRAAEVVALAR
ncbi:MAG TPA: LLM class flavin-dependent oxidoreductase [Candidatus Dormibacteraeota bacterium]